jgi:hypothetical protein
MTNESKTARPVKWLLLRLRDGSAGKFWAVIARGSRSYINREKTRVTLMSKTADGLAVIQEGEERPAVPTVGAL